MRKYSDCYFDTFWSYQLLVFSFLFFNFFYYYIYNTNSKVSHKAWSFILFHNFPSGALYIGLNILTDITHDDPCFFLKIPVDIVFHTQAPFIHASHLHTHASTDASAHILPHIHSTTHHPTLPTHTLSNPPTLTPHIWYMPSYSQC